MNTPPEPQPFIVIVEDDKDLATLISTHLELAGMQSLICHEAGHAESFLQNNFANLLLLDLYLPDSSGLALIKSLRKSGNETPVIFLTGENSSVQKVKALEMGGDDYITKPFGFPELIARIQAVLRRTETTKDAYITNNVTTADKPFSFCGAEINPQRLEISFPDGETESIGLKTLGIFSYLSSNPNLVLTRKHIIHAIWGVHADVYSRSLDQYISKIREQFKRHGLSLDAFQTIRGVGYFYAVK